MVQPLLSVSWRPQHFSSLSWKILPILNASWLLDHCNGSSVYFDHVFVPTTMSQTDISARASIYVPVSCLWFYFCWCTLIPLDHACSLLLLDDIFILRSTVLLLLKCCVTLCLAADCWSMTRRRHKSFAIALCVLNRTARFLCCHTLLGNTNAGNGLRLPVRLETRYSACFFFKNMQCCILLVLCIGNLYDCKLLVHSSMHPQSVLKLFLHQWLFLHPVELLTSLRHDHLRIVFYVESFIFLTHRLMSLLCFSRLRSLSCRFRRPAEVVSRPGAQVLWVHFLPRRSVPFQTSSSRYCANFNSHLHSSLSFGAVWFFFTQWNRLLSKFVPFVTHRTLLISSCTFVCVSGCVCLFCRVVQSVLRSNNSAVFGKFPLLLPVS